MGKTTLLEDWCKKHTEYEKITEVARGIMKDGSITRIDLQYYLKNDKQKFWEFQQAIFEEQNHKECDMLTSGTSFITDRGPDPLVFVLQNIDYSSAMKLAETNGAQMCLERYRSKNCRVIVVCPLDKIEDDCVRLVPTVDEQLQYTESLQKLLHNLKIPFKYCGETGRLERIQWLEEVALETSFLNT